MLKRGYIRRSVLGLILAVALGGLSVPGTVYATEGTEPVPAVQEEPEGSEIPAETSEEGVDGDGAPAVTDDADPALSGSDEMDGGYVDLSDYIVQAGGSPEVRENNRAGYDTAIFDSALEEDELEELLYQTMLQRKTSVDISKFKIKLSDQQSFSKCYYNVFNNHAELFYLKPGYEYSYNASNVITVIKPGYNSYTAADTNTFNSRVAQILSGVKSSWSDVEKALYIHDFLVTNCDYDTSLNKRDAYTALVTGSTVCQGYSLAYTYLMNELGVPCDTITANSKSGGAGHAWNLIQLGGKWYHVDCTHDDPTNGGGVFCVHENFVKSENVFGNDGDHDHYSPWVIASKRAISADGKATDTRYDEYFWDDARCALAEYNGSWAHGKADGIYLYNFGTGTDTLLKSETFMYDIPGSYSYYSGFRGTLLTGGGALYIPLPTSIIKFDQTGTESTVYTLTSEEAASGCIYEIAWNGSALEYVIYNKPIMTSGRQKVKTGVVSSGPATPLEITDQPVSVEYTNGEAVSFKVTATGTGLNYKWEKKAPGKTSFSTISGAVYDTLALVLFKDDDGTVFRCKVTDASGNTATSDEVTATRIKAPLNISKQPEDRTYRDGDVVTFSVTATGDSLTYQWQNRMDESDPWMDIRNATKSTYSTTMRAAQNGMMFRCVITSDGEEYESDPATATWLHEELKITEDLYEFFYYKSGTATGTNPDRSNGKYMEIEAQGEDLTYQWQYRANTSGAKWSNISGATKARLAVKMTTSYDDKYFRCMVTDASGSTVYSAEALVWVYQIEIMYYANGGTLTYENGIESDHLDKFIHNSSYIIEDLTKEEEQLHHPDGLVFAGWYTQATGGTKVAVGTKVTKDTTLYAHWKTDAPMGIHVTAAVNGEAVSTYHTGDKVALSATLDSGIIKKIKWEYTVDGSTYKSCGTKANITYTLSKTFAGNDVTFRCTVTDDEDSEGIGTVVLSWEPRKVTITSQSDSAGAGYITGGKINLAVTATGEAKSKPKYQWWSHRTMGDDEVVDPEEITAENGWSMVPKATKAKLALTVTNDISGSAFVCVVSNEDGFRAVTKTIKPGFIEATVTDARAEAGTGTVISIGNVCDYSTGTNRIFMATATITEGGLYSDRIPAKTIKYQWWSQKEGEAAVAVSKKTNSPMLSLKNIKGDQFRDTAIWCVISTEDDEAETQKILMHLVPVKINMGSVSVNNAVMEDGGEFTYNTVDKVNFKMAATSESTKVKITGYRWESLAANLDPDTALSTDWVVITRGKTATAKVSLDGTYDGAYIRCAVTNGENTTEHSYIIRARKVGVPITGVSITPNKNFTFKDGKVQKLTAKATSKKKPLYYSWESLAAGEDPDTSDKWQAIEGANAASYNLQMTKGVNGNMWFRCAIRNEEGGETVYTPAVCAQDNTVYDSPAVKAEDTDLELATELMNSMSVRLTRASSAADEIILPQEITEDDDTKVLAMIATNAFKGYKGSVIEIPDTVTKIAKNAFAGTSGIDTVKLAVKNPTKLTIAKNAFADLADGTTVEITASDRNRFKRVADMIERSGAKNLVFKYVKAE